MRNGKVLTGNILWVEPSDLLIEWMWHEREKGH